QPYVAEFLKRSAIPSPRVTIKIASLEHRSAFAIRQESGSRVGFEVGGDVFANLDLDDYYSHDRNPSGAFNFFGELLYRHLASELPDDYLVKVHGIATPLDLVARLFDKNGTFADLVRAGQGVVRDFLGIYKHAFFHGLRMETPVITADAVHTAAVEWLEVDKLTNLEPDLYDVLRRLVDEVV